MSRSKRFRRLLLNRASSLIVTSGGKLDVNIPQSSYRDLVPEGLLSEADRVDLYMQFCKECSEASEGTKKKMKRRLGL
jgi:hypothetical protein